MKKYLFTIGTSCAIFNINSGSCRSGNEGSKNKSNKKPDPLKNGKDTLKAILKFKNDHLEDGQSITITKEQIDEAKSAEEIKNLKQELEKIRTKSIPFANVVIDPNNIDLTKPYIIKATDDFSGEKEIVFILLASNGKWLEQNNDEDSDAYMAMLFKNVYVLGKLPENAEDVVKFFDDPLVDKYFLYVEPYTLTITGYNAEIVNVNNIDDLIKNLGKYILFRYTQICEFSKDSLDNLIVTFYSKTSA